MEADISQVHGMEIPGVVSWDCDSGQVWVTESRRKLRLKNLWSGYGWFVLLLGCLRIRGAQLA